MFLYIQVKTLQQVFQFAKYLREKMESITGMYKMEAVAREEPSVEGAWCSIDET